MLYIEQKIGSILSVKIVSYDTICRIVLLDLNALFLKVQFKPD
jgi:hypothetical protein